MTTKPKLKPCIICGKEFEDADLLPSKVLGIVVFTCRACDKANKDKLGAETNPIEDSGFRTMKAEIKGSPSNLPTRRR